MEAVYEQARKLRKEIVPTINGLINYLATKEDVKVFLYNNNHSVIDAFLNLSGLKPDASAVAAFTVMFEGHCMIFVDATINEQEQLLGLAHEFSHVYLRHMEHLKESTVRFRKMEANAFAYELLFGE